jgi:hypothetical protein
MITVPIVLRQDAFHIGNFERTFKLLLKYRGEQTSIISRQVPPDDFKTYISQNGYNILTRHLIHENGQESGELMWVYTNNIETTPENTCTTKA